MSFNLRQCKACHVTRKPNAEQYFVMPVEKCYGNAMLQLEVAVANSLPAEPAEKHIDFSSG